MDATSDYKSLSMLGCSSARAGRKACALRSWDRVGSEAFSVPSWRAAEPTSTSWHAVLTLQPCASTDCDREHGRVVQLAQRQSDGRSRNDRPSRSGDVRVKLWDTEQAARSLKPIIGRETALISFQNGVQKDDLLRPIVGRARSWAGRLCGHEHQPARCHRPEGADAAPCVRRVRRPPLAPRRRVSFGRQRGGINAEISPDVRSEIGEVHLPRQHGGGDGVDCKSLGPVRSHP